MTDLEIELDNRPGSLARLGEKLGESGVSIEGGGVFALGAKATAHFLFRDGAAARRAVEAAGFRVVSAKQVLTPRLNQNLPGQLGKISRCMAEAGVNIEVMYSDHEHRLILVVDDPVRGKAVSQMWMREQDIPEHSR